MKKLFAEFTALSLAVGALALPTTARADDKPAPTPEERYKALDKDSDGKLTWDEFKGKQTDEEKLKKAKARFEKMDTNKDMSLTLEEYKAGQKAPAA